MSKHNFNVKYGITLPFFHLRAKKERGIKKERKRRGGRERGRKGEWKGEAERMSKEREREGRKR